MLKIKARALQILSVNKYLIVFKVSVVTCNISVGRSLLSSRKMSSPWPLQSALGLNLLKWSDLAMLAVVLHLQIIFQTVEWLLSNCLETFSNPFPGSYPSTTLLLKSSESLVDFHHSLWQSRTNQMDAWGLSKTILSNNVLTICTWCGVLDSNFRDFK